MPSATFDRCVLTTGASLPVIDQIREAPLGEEFFARRMLPCSHGRSLFLRDAHIILVLPLTFECQGRLVIGRLPFSSSAIILLVGTFVQ